jgi:glycosyltransferase involved in cell wall biosynthesis
MSAFRLLSKLTPADPLNVTLAHGCRDQQSYPLFAAQKFISPVNGSIPSQAAFIWQGCRWLSQHRKSFDVFYGLQAFDFTVSPAKRAHDLGMPAIVKVVQHNSDLADRPGWRALLNRAKIRRDRISQLSAVVAISDAIAEELAGYGVPEQKIARIPNGVDTDHFHPVSNSAARSTLRRELGWADENTILFVGAITPRKRPHLLIEAAGKLKSRGSFANLVFAGPIKDSAYGDAMRAMADELGVQKQVRWIGFVDDTMPLYQAADVFVLTSSNEGMPNALLEAMACGLPSVVTPIPGTADLVRDGEEALFVTPTASSVADALAQYIQSTSLREAHGSAARNRAVSKFSARRVLDRHIGLYERVLAGKDAAEA